ncbi:hypothetical protein GCM10009710_19810 [Aeromicrobium alkaliterrae]|uniref:Tyr recombinase domain-containing protein n=2 Tax=Aeromicrobium alkaliterrae TaxID=302168 RepID=A0ABN2JUN6_9ACTN
MGQVLDFARRTGTARDDYLWGSGSRPRDLASFYRRRFAAAARVAGLAPVRIHDLRHTYACLMSHLGHRAVEVSAWMGHANVAFTLQTYTHLFEDREHEEQRCARLDAAFLSER